MANLCFVHLRGNGSSLIVDCRGPAPLCLYWGRRFDTSTEPEQILAMNHRDEAPASAQNEPAITLTPQHGEGFTGQTGLRAHRNGRQWGFNPKIRQVLQPDAQTLVVISDDKQNGLQIIHRLHLEPLSDVVAATTEIVNMATEDLIVDWCAAPTFPIPQKYREMVAFTGRWAKEFQQQRVHRFPGTYLRENRRGRTSHDCFPGVVLTGEHCDYGGGEALAFHLGWSGNHRLCVDTLPNNSALFQAGELFLPGEMRLAPGENYVSPTLYGVHSGLGLNGIHQSFHLFVRNSLLQERIKQTPRPVHLNTWEALYFDHSPEALATLVDRAAAVGVERFVLDDGWFKGRRNDQAGLGDWFVDRDVYPQGLKPLIEHVVSNGMEFGLWFEPEMVNPDSDLYRRHPDWVLHLPESEPVIARHQLVLDLSRPEVAEYLFSRLDALLDEYDIHYIKWDMNRDIHQPGDANGRAGVHRQTLALYALIDRLRKKYPTLDIESCASGGARADYGILSRTDRIWTSDSNDALDRLQIQKGFSVFFPPEVMGAHIGPRLCHITGRTIPVATRAAVALFGHMGLEVNLNDMRDDELTIIADAIALHKKYRHILHHGKLHRFVSNTYSESFAVLSENEASGLYAYVQIDGDINSFPGRYYFRGLNPNSQYYLECVWGSEPHRRHFAPLTNQAIPAQLLIENGVELPLLMPQSTLIFYLYIAN